MASIPNGACNENLLLRRSVFRRLLFLGAVTMPNLSRAAFTPWLLISFAALPLLSGCGAPKFYPVKGQVILFGVGLLTEGEVRFRPVSKPGLIATGPIQKDGSFSLTTPSHGGGGLEGTCKPAVVVEARQGQPVIRERAAGCGAADIQLHRPRP